MFNLIEAANQLKQLPDDALPQMMQGGDQSIPQYLVMSEIQRRKEMRNSPMMQPSKADRSTVADNMMQEGVAALPQLVDQEPPVQEFNEGGIVALDRYLSDREKDARNAWEDIKQRTRPVSKYFRDIPDHLNRATAPVRNILENNRQGMKRGLEYLQKNTGAGTMDDEIGRSQGALLEMVHGTPEEVAAAEAAYQNKRRGDTGPVDMTGFRTPPLVASQPAPQPAPVPVEEPVVREAPARVARSAPMPVAPMPEPEPMPEQLAGPEGSNEGLAALLGTGDKIEKPTPKSYKDFMPEIEANMPDEYTDIIKRLESKKGTVGQRRKDAMNLALISAGMGMLSSKSSNTMQGIGEGGMAGIAALQRGLADANQYEDSIEDQMIRAQQGKARHKGDIFKMAAGQAEDENRFAMQGYREDKNNERADKRLVYQEQAANKRAETQAERDARLYGYRRELTEYTQGKQDARSKASIAARGSKSGGSKTAKTTQGERDLQAVMEKYGLDRPDAIKKLAELKRKDENKPAFGGAYSPSQFTVTRRPAGQ